MTNAEFTQWRERLNLNYIETAKLLGLARNTVASYDKEGNIPLYVALACAAVAHGIPPIGKVEEIVDAND